MVNSPTLGRPIIRAGSWISARCIAHTTSREGCGGSQQGLHFQEALLLSHFWAPTRSKSEACHRGWRGLRPTGRLSVTWRMVGARSSTACERAGLVLFFFSSPPWNPPKVGEKARSVLSMSSREATGQDSRSRLRAKDTRQQKRDMSELADIWGGSETSSIDTSRGFLATFFLVTTEIHLNIESILCNCKEIAFVKS